MTVQSPGTGYPLRVRGELTEPLSRWLWLVKWLLLIPHLIVLVFLWTAYAVVTVIAFFAILFTGRYPHGLFGFNRGVLRWTWRVTYYGYGALGTDRYPPFTLAEVPDYPATLELDRPGELSRPLVLVKWWLLALPHYLILAALSGAAFSVDDDRNSALSLLAVAVFFAGVALLFGHRYPRGLFDLVIGVNRWGLRVLVYATLMTDVYPPFRLDQGGDEPAAGPPSGPAPEPGTAAAEQPVPPVPSSQPSEPSQPSKPSQPGRTGRIVAIVLGVMLFLSGMALTAAGGTGLWLDAERDADGFISAPARTISSSTAAVTVEDVHLDIDENAAYYLSSEDLGRIRVRAGSTDGSDVFVGIAPQAEVDQWLSGRAHDEVTGIDSGEVQYRTRPGEATVSPPAEQQFWSASASGPGLVELNWRVTSGTWSLVMADPAGTPGVQARATVAARIPSLAGLATGLLIGGLALLIGGAIAIGWGATGLGREDIRSTEPGAEQR